MNDFDRWIKGELENHEATRPESAWDQFASRLDASEAQETASNRFDAAMKQKLDHFEAGYQEQHWQLFRRRLEEQARQRAQMLQLKVLEGALLLLIMLTLWNFRSTDTILPTSPRPIAQISPTLRENASGLHDLPARTVRETNLPGEETSTSVSVTQPPFRPDRSETILLPLTRPAIAVSLADQPSAHPRFAEMTIQTPTLSEGSSRPSMDILEPITTHEPPLLETLPPVLANIPPLAGASSRRHKVSMAIRGDLNYVMTPYDQLLVKKGYDQVVSGYGGMIGYLQEGPTWSWRTDLAYSRTYYLPKPYTEVFDGDIQRGYFAETIRDIELNMVSLSFQVQRTLKRKNRWHTYALLGGTGHLAFQANYDRKQSYIPGADPNTGGPPEPLTQSKTSQKRYADGFFEGGSLAENSYMTIDLGIGLENQLNERVSVFMEPVYQHNPFKKSLGPNNDRINTLGIALGTRISL